MKSIYAGMLILTITFAFSSCKKEQDWLDAKYHKNDVVPKSLSDLQAILDNEYVMNDIYPGIGLVGTDNYYLTNANFNSAPETERNAYLWAKDIFQGQPSYDWNAGYQVVEYANIVLDGLKAIDVSAANKAAYENVEGSALFYRTFAFYTLAQIFCKAYDSTTATSDEGLPLRLNSDVNEKSSRATVEQTYVQMISDLKAAADLLPLMPRFTLRPGKVAVYALLSKIYLSMEDYDSAGDYANKALGEYGTLLDYNSGLISNSSSFRFPEYPNNPEIIFYAYQQGLVTVWPYGSGGLGYVDSSLYNSYSDNDLRKTILYTDNGAGNIQFAGTYSGTFYNFCGIATNELYLIRAECYARGGKTTNAMNDLNTLLAKRYKTGTFEPLTATDADDALAKILKERRKELPFTGQLRWEDLRRLNKDPRFKDTLTRVIEGKTYTLPPNEQRYVYPIPDNELQLSGLAQNPR